MSQTTLQAIRNKVRRITRSPSEGQLTTIELDDYINTVILYDLPERLRLFPTRTVLKFYTQPNVGEYETNTTDVNDPLYNFKNRYISVHPPAFIAGVPAFYTQRREEFYAYYPQVNTIGDTGLTGDGTQGPYSGTLFAKPVIPGNVIFTGRGSLNTGQTLIDTPINNEFGNLSEPNTPPTSTTVVDPNNFINYITGEYVLTFANAITAGQPIKSETIPYQASKPLCILYFDQKFLLRPIPDKVYEVSLEVYIRPSELLDSDESPQLEQWWQYIAILAAKKRFEDQMDMDSVALIMPMLREQESLTLRATLMQAANERTPTIYTMGKNYGYGWGGFFGNGGWPY
jgi:hypothetical protein